MASGPITSWQIGKQLKQWLTLFFKAPKSPQMVIVAIKLKDAYSLEGKVMTNLDSILKSRDISLSNKDPYSQGYGFSRGHVWMWELDYKESWGPKNWCFSTVVLEKTLESPLDCKEIQPVHPKGDQSWVFIGRTDVEAETLIFWSPDVKNWIIWKDPDAGKDWGQEEKGTTEDVWLDGITNSRDLLRLISIEWYNPTISSSAIPFSSCPQYFPASGSFQMIQFFPSDGQNIGVSTSTSVLPINT